MQQPEGYDEPEILSFVCEWLDPWRGAVTEDDLWDWENNSTIDYIQQLQRMMKSWKPQPSEMALHNDKLTQTGQLTMVASFVLNVDTTRPWSWPCRLVRRSHRRPTSHCCALSLLDTGQWHDAKSVLDELIKSDSKDPAFRACRHLWVRHQGREHLEVSLILDDAKETKSGWMLPL